MKKFKHDIIELKRSLEFTKLRLEHEQSRKSDATAALYSRINRTALEVQHLKATIFKIHANASKTMKHYSQEALGIFKQSVLKIQQKLNVSRSSQLFVENRIIQSLKKQLNSLHSSHATTLGALRETDT